MIRLLTLILVLLAGPVFGEADTGRLHVSGSATVEAKPDFATITVSVRTGSNLLADAIGENSASVRRSPSALQAAGLEETEIQTSRYAIENQRDAFIRDNAPKPPDFAVVNSVTFMVRDLELLGRLLGEVSVSGATSLSGPDFGVDDGAPHIAEAHRTAVVDAKEKAELFAQAAGIELGSLLEFHDGILAGDRDGTIAMVEPVMEEPSQMVVPILVGTVSYSAQVSLVYEMLA